MSLTNRRATPRREDTSVGNVADRLPGDDAEYGWLATDVVARQCSIRPGRLAVRELATGQDLTYLQLEDRLRRTDALLRATVSRGARVALLARNSLHHVELFYGCARAGAVFVPLNWRLSGPELAVLCDDARPELVIYEAEFAAEAEGALAGLPGARALCIRPGADLFAESIAATAPRPPSPIRPLSPSMLLYTSGTTGRPKGVVVTPKSAFFAAMNFTYVGELGPDSAQLCDAPLFHVVGLLAIMHASLLAGAVLHLSDRFVPGETLERLTDPALGVTHFFCVPQMAKALLEEPGSAAFDLRGLRLFTGGAPMPAELTLALIERGVRPGNGYGMSENGTVLGVPLDPKVARRKAGSAGVAAPAVEIRLVGPDGADVADGEVGEIWLRGPSVATAYWNQPEATAKAFSDGWFRTGDAARRDADGFYFIVDRWKDMYITGGENVYPAEVELVIAAMDGVADAAVVGVPDPRWGESGVAYVVLRPGAEPDPARVVAWCDARLARYKRPSQVRFVEALPRTASGKIQKDVLRREFAAQQQNKTESAS